VLVTGATGFVGRHLCRALAASGADVHAVVRSGSSRAVDHPVGVTTHVVDDATAEYPAVAEAVRPGVVFHLATHFAARHSAHEIARMVDANVTFGTVVADTAAKAGTRLVHATSAWQHYGGAEYAPVSLYAATKQALSDVLEYYVQVEGLDAREVCLFDTYGPDDDRKKLVWVLLEHAATGAPLAMSSGLQLVDLTHVRDVVRALRHAAGVPGATGRLVARSGAPLTVRDLARTVEDVTGRPVNAQWGAREPRPREMTENWSVPGSLAGWAPTTELADGLAELWDERTRTHG
jgi:nucleoside-diphosphate-sugar epimerase